MYFYLLILLLVLIFYTALPLLGAFVVRSQWRVFRKTLQSSLFFSDIIKPSPFVNRSLGSRKILGKLEALEGNDMIWVRGPQNKAITVEMRKGTVFFMPPLKSIEKLYPHLLPVPLPALSLEKVPWDDVFSLPEGTKMYISGDLYYEDGRYTFRSTKETPLMVLIYNGDPLHLVSRAVWCGRQNNEFWNFLTPWSFFSGILLLLILSVYLIQNSANYLLQFFSISMALLPAMLFLPPGVLLFNLYKTFWDTARRYRAERDLMKLTMDPENGQINLKDQPGQTHYSRQPSAWNRKGKAVLHEINAILGLSDTTITFPVSPEKLVKFCRCKAFLYEALSGFVLLGGMLVNFYVLWIVLNWF